MTHGEHAAEYLNLAYTKARKVDLFESHARNAVAESLPKSAQYWLNRAGQERAVLTVALEEADRWAGNDRR